MSSVQVYQIGRLDSNVFNEHVFYFEGESSTSSLSSFAIKQILESKGKSTDVFLFYPISLAFSPHLAENSRFVDQAPEGFTSELRNAVKAPDAYLKSPTKFFDSHPHSKAAKGYRIIHSLGKYPVEAKGGGVSFQRCHYSDIILEIFLDIVRNYFDQEEKVSRIIFDISSGHNIYVSALLTAARQFRTLLSLRYLGQDGRMPRIEAAFSEPILEESTTPKISVEEVRAGIFFSSPVRSSDLNNFALSRAIFPGKDERAMKSKLHSLLKKFLCVFGAVRNNAPLFVYHSGYDSEDSVEDCFSELCGKALERLYRSYRESPGLNHQDYVRALLALQLYYGLIRLFRQKRVIKYDPEGGINIAEIKDVFIGIYETLGLPLNRAVLSNEVDQLLREKRKVSTTWMYLVKLIKEDMSSPHDPPNKRNFFAHAGFESNVTQARKGDNNLHVRHSGQNISTLERWLMESAG